MEKESYMVRLLKMAVVLLSEHLLPNQYLLHLYPAHMTDLYTLLFPAPLTPHSLGCALCWFSW